jgi:hypothetical protein
MIDGDMTISEEPEPKPNLVIRRSTQMTGRRRVARPRPPTTGVEVRRKVDSQGAVSFAGTGYRVGNRCRGQTEVKSSATPSRSPKTGPCSLSTGLDTIPAEIRGTNPTPRRTTESVA